MISKLIVSLKRGSSLLRVSIIPRIPRRGSISLTLFGLELTRRILNVGFFLLDGFAGNGRGGTDEMTLRRTIRLARPEALGCQEVALSRTSQWIACNKEGHSLSNTSMTMGLSCSS